MRVCTILARNYLARARVLMASLGRHHPGVEVDVVVIDAVRGDRAWFGREADGVRLTVLGFDDLEIDDVERRRMRAFYDVYELATAVKPAVLRRSLAAAPDDVTVYLDPDTVVLAPLVGLEERARAGNGIVLTPHVRAPIPLDDRLVDEPTLLQSGAFNLGFLALGAGAGPFLDWWEPRLRTHALVDRAAGLFTDQKWLDLAVPVFEPAVLTDPGWNVAFWNLHERPVARGADGSWTAGGSPLRLFHFSGYDPDHPHLVARHQGPRPRLLLSAEPALAELFRWYDGELRRHDWAETHAEPYGWGTLRGRPFPTWLRRTFRDATLRPGLDAPPPDPYDDEEGFVAWLSEPVAASRSRCLTRLIELHWWHRGDLRLAFPTPWSADLDRLVDWADVGADETFQRDVGHLFDRTSTTPAPSTFAGVTPIPGITIAGYVGAALGIGESARSTIRAAEACGLPIDVLVESRVAGADIERVRHPRRQPLASSLSVLVVNADALPGFLARHGHELPPSASRVGFWAWELETFPLAYHGSLDLVDEVWTPSSFVGDAVARVADIPVRVFPVPVVADAPTALRRADLGLPEGRYVFGFAFDARSVVDRKNPAATLRAYLAAFGPDDGAALVIKVMHGLVDPCAMEELAWLAGARPDITVVDELWSGPRARAFIQLVDCYVSLHRSEGYGRGLAQATAQGTPVIATGWSGNTDFMDAATSVLVPFELVPVGEGRVPYPADAMWAAADEHFAAAAMRRLADDPAEGVRLGAAASRAVLERFTIEAAASFLRDAAIDATRATVVV